ncbi:MAG: membrane protein insertase YidC [Rhizobiales bacterium]|nr:membrane protein insertase YidC [Hyphomicrobiales bacterium]
MQDNKNLIVAVALSVLVLIGWQFLVWGPQVEKERLAAEQRQAELVESGGGLEGSSATPRAPASSDSAVPRPGGDPVELAELSPEASGTRADIIATGSRIPIDTPSLLGSINLLGGRVDDVSLKNYREEPDLDSPIIELFSPSGSPNPYYADFGWVGDSGSTLSLPKGDTLWQTIKGVHLTVDSPLTIRWDNGEGLKFLRTFTIDESYLITVTDRVENNTGAEISLFPYALVARHDIPEIANFFILHEGMIGFVGEEGLQEVDYDDLQEEGSVAFEAQTTGWLGITDKYWAAAVVPMQGQSYTSRFLHRERNGRDIFQADFLGEIMSVASGATGEYVTRLFAGAKEVNVINSYREDVGIERFDLVIDWGYFYFITKPLFAMIDWMYKFLGNFGLAILASTVVIKLLFFPLANKSYSSMANMKKVQPQVAELRERYGDDRARQQKEMMELYKKEKINPLAGCLPIVLQIPVFFALYKVLFVTIEMRHAPFFGWIKDLASPDPTSVFNLFGLIPFDPPTFLMVGVWPLIMGVTMFVQMRLNPTPPDKTQAMIFTWMPIMFTFMLASFPAGLVIYWAWNNSLSILQQVVIMRRQDVPVEIWKNTKEAFGFGKKPEDK